MKTLFAMLISLSVVFGSLAAAQDTGIEITGGSARITVQTGTTSIQEGPPSGPTGPIYRCSFQTEGHGQWHTQVINWNDLATGDDYYRVCQSDTAPPILGWVVWNPGDPDDGLGVSTHEIRNWIDNNLLTPVALPPATSPDGQQITGLETWFWPGASTDGATVQASAGGLTVQVRSVFESMEFDLGEPGVPRLICEDYVEWTPGASESPCTHTYLTESDVGGFPLVSQTNWRFDWLDFGAAAFEPYGIAQPVFADLIEVRDLEAVISADR